MKTLLVLTVSCLLPSVAAAKDHLVGYQVVDIRCPKGPDDWGYVLSRNTQNIRSAMTVTFRDGKPVRVVIGHGERHQPMGDFLDLDSANPAIREDEVAMIKAARQLFEKDAVRFCAAGTGITSEGARILEANRERLGLESKWWKSP